MRRTGPSCVPSPAQIIYENGAKSGYEMCFAASTFGAGGKTRLESSIKKFNPHLSYDALGIHLRVCRWSAHTGCAAPAHT